MEKEGAEFCRNIVTVVTTVTLASSNNTLPDDGDYTEICRSCFQF
jgi:hypothetical protein